MSIECDKCGKSFTRRENLNNHMIKNACKEIKVRCRFCNKGFTSSQSMYRHIRTVCQTKKTIDDDKDRMYERLLALEAQNKKIAEENKNLKKRMTKLKKNTGPIMTINNTNCNINNGTVNNIYLVGYGKEDLTKIDKDDMLSGFKLGFNSTLKLIDTIHFNPKYPEYHNIYISSMKNKYAMMYDGNAWTLVMKDDLIDKLYDHKRDYIEENLDDFLYSLSPSQKKALHRWMDVDDDHPYISKIKNDIKLLLYNKRELPMNNRHQQVLIDENNGVNIDIMDLDDHTNTDDEIDLVNILDITKLSEDMTNTVVERLANNDNKNPNMIKHKIRTAGRPGTKRKIITARKAQYP